MRFYLVSIVFIIFDLEIAFPVSVGRGLSGLSDVAFWSMMVCLACLNGGFGLRMEEGGREWE